jgi:hypothetical protein
MKANEERVVIEEPRLARLIFADTQKQGHEFHKPTPMTVT